MVAELPRLLDPDDLLSMPDGDNYELIDGIPVEKEMGFESEKIAFDLGTILNNFVKLHRLGTACGSNTGFAAFPGRPKLFRKPDGMFFAKGRLPAGQPITGFVKIAPDLAIEVVSPENTAEGIEEKIGLYRSAGVKLIWVVYPKARKAYVHRIDGTTSEVGPDGSLSGEDVIPGFSCRIAEIFED